MTLSPGRTLNSTLGKSKDVLNQEVNNVIRANASPELEHASH